MIFEDGYLTNVFTLLIELTVLGLVFFGIEKIKPAQKDFRYFKDDFWQEFGLGIINLAIATPIYVIAIGAMINLVIAPIIPHQMFNESIGALPLIVQAFLGAFIIDFSTYWRHRFTHSYLWKIHSIHHSALHISWLTAIRLHPLDFLVAMLFDLTILYIFGFESAGMVIAILMIKAFNYFTHANIYLQFDKPVRYIFTSPNYHRWHHAEEKEAHNKNFCAMFSLLDVMFGTYYHPEGVPKGYGIGEDQKDYPKTLLGQLTYPFRKKRNGPDSDSKK